MNSKCVSTFKFCAQAIFNAAKKNTTPPALENLSLRNCFFLFYIISSQTIYIYQKFHDTNRFVKLRAVSRLFTFFLIQPVDKWFIS
jgi:hypothetical protein